MSNLEIHRLTKPNHYLICSEFLITKSMLLKENKVKHLEKSINYLADAFNILGIDFKTEIISNF